jgi:hypothetical protein
MRYRFVLSALLLAGLFLRATPARAQEGKIFAGNFFETLYAAIDMGYLRLDNADFRYQILQHGLNALVILDVPPGGELVVLKGGRETTQLSRLTLKQADWDRLRKFASDEVFEALRQFQATPKDPKRAQELRRAVEGVRAENRQQAERFVGARVAEMVPPENHQLSPYVKAYRKHVEERMGDELRRPDAKNLPDGIPHAFGSQSLPRWRLQGVGAKDVETIRVGDRVYTKVWVEGALVVVPQAKGAPQSAGGSGLDKLGLAPTAREEVHHSHPEHKTPIVPAPRRK